MRLTPPEYFEPIRQGAERRWQQLEADPELAGPWHQLFKQVQSPRHVLSELLQNADDAGATKASAVVNNDFFKFSHNGEDFKSDHFASLCRFGYSNKRSLHTIGFRGIGFKSTFSLGSKVSIETPSLNIFFNKNQFTLPHWDLSEKEFSTETVISVKISDERRGNELSKNLNEWEQSPISLLFFRSLRKLTINNNELIWHKIEPGPIENSQWYELNNNASYKHLVIQSSPKEFPPECINEIRQERIVDSESTFSLPASQVEIVLGSGPGLFVILPTSVKPNLPFAFNGPFLQDPARVKIKDPETSLTNQWLLKRVGELAYESMNKWLNNTSLDIKKRAEAYRFLPEKRSIETGVNGSCVEEIEISFFSHLASNPNILTNTGSLERRGKCVSIDKQLQDIWPHNILTHQIIKQNKLLTSEHISKAAIDLLDRIGEIEKISKTAFCILLSESKPPVLSNENLLLLWLYIAPIYNGFQKAPVALQELPIVPIAGNTSLVPSGQVVKFSSAIKNLNENDINFISNYLLLLSKNWVSFLESKSDDYPIMQGQWTSILAKDVGLSLLNKMGLTDSFDTSKIIEKIIDVVESNNSISVNILIRLAHLCAHLECRVPKNFKYILGNNNVRSYLNGVSHDMGNLDQLLPKEYLQSQVISELYNSCFTSCTDEEWQIWKLSPKSELSRIFPLQKIELSFRHSSEIIEHIQLKYSYQFDPKLFPFNWDKFYPTQNYVLIDYDIPDEITNYWYSNERTEHSLQLLTTEFLSNAHTNWFQFPFVQILQSNRSGQRLTPVDFKEIPTSWLSRFKNANCLRDTRGNYCKPYQLLCRSEETEQLIGIERFIEQRLDTDANKHILDYLGVSDAIPGPQLLLTLLAALSKIDKPPINEIIKIYEQLDRQFQGSSLDDQQVIVKEFTSQKLIFTEDGHWVFPYQVYILADDFEVVGLNTVMTSLSALSLWRHIGLSERPNSSNAIEFMNTLETGIEINQDLLKFVVILLKRFPEQILTECRIWISMLGRLEDLDTLLYASKTSEIDSYNLFDIILSQTADLSFFENCNIENLMRIGSFHDLQVSIEYALNPDSSIKSQAKDCPQWLQTFGECIANIDNSNDYLKFDNKSFGARLQNLKHVYVSDLSLIPLIKGRPIGRSFKKDGAIINNILYLNYLNVSKLASLIPSIIGDYLENYLFQSAASYCFDRPCYLIIDYFNANFIMKNLLNGKEKFGVFDDSIDQNRKLVGNEVKSLINIDSIACKPIYEFDLDDCAQLIQAEEVQSEIVNKISSESKIQLNDCLIIEVGNNPLGQHDNQENISEIKVNKPILDYETIDEEINKPINESINKHIDDSTNVSPLYQVISKYAKMLNMIEVVEGIFQAVDGSKLIRQRSEVFPWVYFDSDGQEIKRFALRSSPLISSPIEIDTVAFGLLECMPLIHSILLPDTQGNIRELSGLDVESLINSGKLKVYPASYRLALINDSV